MSDSDLIGGINSIVAVTYFGLVIAIALRQLDRVMRHRLMRRESPHLLIRDLVFFWSLALLLVLPAVAGAFGVNLSQFLWWVLVRAGIGISVLTVFAYYEFVVIGRNGSHE